MKFALLLLFSPFVTSSFTSMCPQQPNNVVVNCNNQNPFNPFPGTVIPGRGRVLGRVLDIGYNKPPTGSKLEFQLQKSDSSEESSESDESSEEIHDHRIPFYPLTLVSHPQIPSIHTTTTVDNKLDFMRRGLGGGFRNNLRTMPMNHATSTSDHLSLGLVNTGMTETMKPSQLIDETHGHGHSGQYNHNVHNTDGHDHHEHNHGHNHGHMHDHHAANHIFIPTHITHPSTISGAHIIPDHVVPVGNIHTGATADIFVPQGNLNLDRKDPRTDSPKLQVTEIDPTLGATTGHQTVDLLHDTHDRLILSRRGYRALEKALSSRTYELFPQDLLDRVIMTMSVPTVTQDGLNTEINCEQIPIVSEIPQTEALHGQTLVSHSEMLPENAQDSSTLITSENVDSHAHFPQTHGESTVTKVTTTKVEERPMTTGIKVPVQESSGSSSTVTKVTTTKTEERPTVETIVHGRPAQTGSTITKVTTTKTEGRPITTSVVAPTEMGSTVTKVTTTTVEKRPVTTDTITETFVEGAPMQTGSSSGSTITKVTTTKTEVPINADINTHGSTGQTSSTVTKVTTTTTTEDRPSTSNIETTLHEIPDVISGKHGSG